MRGRTIRAVLALVAASLAAACGTRKDLPFAPDTGVPDPEATFARVEKEILTPSCAVAGCHTGAAPAGGLDLSAGRAYASIVHAPAVESPSLARITPGDPERSYLVKKVRGDGDISGGRMPLGGPYLSPMKIRLLIDWVRRGAPLD